GFGRGEIRTQAVHQRQRGLTYRRLVYDCLMLIAMARRLACLMVMMCVARSAAAAEIVIGDGKTQPESLAMAGGVLYVGSASTPFVYKVRAGATTAEKFVDATAEGPGTFFLGMLADAASNTLWACQLAPLPNTTPALRR